MRRAQTLLLADEAGPTRRSRRPCTAGSRPWPAPGSGASRKAWPRRWLTIPARARPRSSVRSSKPSPSRSPAPNRRKGACAGRCNCWPTAWSSWRSSRTFPMNRFGGCSKKQAQALAEAGMGHSDRRGGVRLADGRPAGPVRRAVRSRPPGGRLRRIQQTIGGRDPRSRSHGARAPRAVRLPSTPATARPTCSCSSSRVAAGATSR